MAHGHVLLAGILLLQIVTALILAANLYACMRRKELPKPLRLLRAAYLRCKDRLSGDISRVGSVDQRVATKYQLALCDLLVAGGKLMVVVLFFRLMIFQFRLITNGDHLLSPALDVSSVAAYASTLFMVSFRQLVTPRSLDAWYFLMQSLCVLPVVLTDPSNPDDLASISLITLLPRFLVGLCPRHGWCAVAGNFLHWLLALQQGGFRSTFAPQTAEFGILVAGILAVRRQIHTSVRTSLDLKTRTIELEAVSGLLLGFCDAVVEVEEETLKLTEDSRQLSTMLLHGQRLGSGGLAGRDFLEFFSEEDRSRIKESLGSGSTRSQTLAINARMLDSLGSYVKVELLHIQFRNPDGDGRRLIGMREFQDLASVAPAMSSQQMLHLRHEEVPLAVPLAVSAAQEEVSLMFDANTFDILSVSNGFQALCASVGQALDFEGLSVFDLSKGTGPRSFSRQMQEAIHAYDENPERSFTLAGLDLLGACQLDATVTFAEDSILKSLVGTLTVNVSTSPPTLTERNLAMLQGGSGQSSGQAGKHPRASNTYIVAVIVGGLFDRVCDPGMLTGPQDLIYDPAKGFPASCGVTSPKAFDDRVQGVGEFGHVAPGLHVVNNDFAAAERSAWHGPWAEQPLLAAERLLAKAFQLGRPEWLNETYYKRHILAWQGEGNGSTDRDDDLEEDAVTRKREKKRTWRRPCACESLSCARLLHFSALQHFQAAQKVKVPDAPTTHEGAPVVVEDRLYQSMMSSVDQAYHDVPLFLHCLTEQVERTLGGDAQQKEDQIALQGLEEYLSAAFDDAICEGTAPGRPSAPPMDAESPTECVTGIPGSGPLLQFLDRAACRHRRGPGAQLEGQPVLAAVHEVLGKISVPGSSRSGLPEAAVLCAREREALKHRFYPFAPGVAPEELEQLLLIHAFQDLLAKAQPERTLCCADRIWREQIPASLLGQTLEAALRSEPFADAAYLPRHDALLLALHHRAVPGRVIWHAWQGDLLADAQDAKWQSSALVTHPTYNDWSQVHGSGLVSSSTPKKLQVVENMDAREVGYNAIVEKLACPPDGSLILVSRMESGIRRSFPELGAAPMPGRFPAEAAKSRRTARVFKDNLVFGLVADETWRQWQLSFQQAAAEAAAATTEEEPPAEEDVPAEGPLPFAETQLGALWLVLPSGSRVTARPHHESAGKRGLLDEAVRDGMPLPSLGITMTYTMVDGQTVQVFSDGSIQLLRPVEGRPISVQEMTGLSTYAPGCAADMEVLRMITPRGALIRKLSSGRTEVYYADGTTSFRNPTREELERQLQACESKPSSAKEYAACVDLLTRMLQVYSDTPDTSSASLAAGLPGHWMTLHADGRVFGRFFAEEPVEPVEVAEPVDPPPEGDSEEPPEEPPPSLQELLHAYPLETGGFEYELDPVATALQTLPQATVEKVPLSPSRLSRKAAAIRKSFQRPKFWVLGFGWCLAACAGAANVIAFKCWSLYASHVTGSTSAIAFRLEGYHQGEYGSETLKEACSLVFSFLVGAYTCGILIDKNQVHFLGKAFYGLALVLNSALLVSAAFVPGRLLAASLVAAACGLQNAMCTSHFGTIIRTTHVTGTMTDIGSTMGRISMIYLRRACRCRQLTDVERAEIGVDARKLGVLSGLWSFYLIGGLVGIYMENIVAGPKALLIPASVTGSMGLTYMACRQLLKDYIKKLEKERFSADLKEAQSALAHMGSRLHDLESGGQSDLVVDLDEEMGNMIEALHEVEADFDNLYQQSSHAAWLEQWNCRQSSRVSGGSSAASHPEAARRRFV
ncbi:unnamed protein product [Symbiodinium natans]|uniref:Uncharacterized protein n=1 Tax=Symbiodinium natans TaxID=878477 RepID=A0A812NCR2_9DINO|nr:unnamed protein product [Symbiodinium natans]